MQNVDVGNHIEHEMSGEIIGKTVGSGCKSSQGKPRDETDTLRYL